MFVAHVETTRLLYNLVRILYQQGTCNDGSRGKTTLQLAWALAQAQLQLSL